jgi:exonuclease-1
VAGRAFSSIPTRRLHKGVFACSTDIVLGVPTDKYLSFCLNRLSLLRRVGIVPIMVFDGARLPGKAGTEDRRRR